MGRDRCLEDDGRTFKLRRGEDVSDQGTGQVALGLQVLWGNGRTSQMQISHPNKAYDVHAPFLLSMGALFIHD